MKTHAIPAHKLARQQLEQIAEGGERIVYDCADFPGLVFKLQKPASARVQKRRDLKTFLMQRLPQYYTYSCALEYQTYVRLCLRKPDLLEVLPVARLYGFVASDLGTLQICEKVSLDGQSVGPNLNQCFRDKTFDAEDVVALSTFASRLLAADVPVHDMNAGNIIKGLDADGAVRFAVVDGLGDIKLIPMQRFSARARRAYLIRKFSGFNRFGLKFDPQSFRFSAQSVPAKSD